MNASVNFSIFVHDGSAFGIATVTVETAHRLLMGDVVQLPCMVCCPKLDFVDGYPLTVEAVHLEHEPLQIIACDVVLKTQGDAWRLVEHLDEVGADCDVWGWTKIDATWRKDEQPSTEGSSGAGST